MKIRLFDIIVILGIAGLLITLNQLDLLEKSARFMVIPILTFYFIGRYAERKFQKSKFSCSCERFYMNETNCKTRI